MRTTPRFFVTLGTLMLLGANIFALYVMDRQSLAIKEASRTLTDQQSLIAALKSEVSSYERLRKSDRELKKSELVLISSISTLEGIKWYQRKLLNPGLVFTHALLWSDIAGAYNASPGVVDKLPMNWEEAALP